MGWDLKFLKDPRGNTYERKKNKKSQRGAKFDRKNS